MKPDAPDPSAVPVTARPMAVSPEIRFRGQISTHLPGLVHGEIEGVLASDRKAILGEQGRLRGSIDASSCEVHGILQGEIFTRHLTAVSRTGEFRGTLQAGALEIEEGARVLAVFEIGCEETLTVRERLVRRVRTWWRRRKL